MTTHAIIALQQQLREAQSDYADVAADKKRAVDAAADKVADLQRAINTLEAAEHARPGGGRR